MNNDEDISKLKEYDSKLKSLCKYIDKRIELHERRLHKAPSLYHELGGILFYMDFLGLDDHFAREIRAGLDSLGENVGRVADILEVLKVYKQRIRNNTFTNFFSEDNEPGLYRIDFINGDFYLDYYNNALEALILAKIDIQIWK